MKKHRLLAAVLCSAMILSMTACGNSNNSGGEGAAEQSQETTTAAETVKETVAETTTAEAEEPAENALKDGTYTGTAAGHNGDITVSVEVKNGVLSGVAMKEHHETNGIGDKAMETVLSVINQSGSTAVDAVSNATISSNGVVRAVREALKEAGAGDAYFAAEEITALPGKEYADSYTYDVVVVGAGGAGLSAAVEAAGAGAKVAVLEKTPASGGNTLVSGGGLNAPGTQHQKNQGIEDSVERFCEDTYNSGDKEADYDLVKVMAENALAAVNWLIDDIQVEFMPDRLQQFGGHSVPRALIPVGNHGDELINKLEAAAEEAGVDLFFSVKGEELLKTDGRVTGVAASYHGQDIIFHAEKGVILATGGFASNVEMRKEYNPNYDERFKTTARDVSDGEGILMAQNAGAALVDMEFIQVYPTCNPYTGIISYVANARMDGGILVNQDGQRFIDEMGRRDVISNAILEQEGQYAYLIWGGEIENTGHMTQVHEVEFEQWKKMGILYEAGSVEEAAEAFGIDPQKLQMTVDAYNESIADGVDEDYNRGGTLRSIKEGPFYIQKVVPSAHHTMGGVAINTKAQVLDEKGQVIDGLYAAGEVTGDIHGTNRLGGNAITDCVVFGRIAGENITKE